MVHAQLTLAVSKCKGGFFLHDKKKSNGVLVTVSDEAKLANETLRTLIGPYADAIGKEKKFSSRAKRVSRQKHSRGCFLKWWSSLAETQQRSYPFVYLGAGTQKDMAAFGSNTKVVYQRDGGDVVLVTPNIVDLCTWKTDWVRARS